MNENVCFSLKSKMDPLLNKHFSDYSSAFLLDVSAFIIDISRVPVTTH
jgi:hypothetical protein